MQFSRHPTQTQSAQSRVQERVKYTTILTPPHTNQTTVLPLPPSQYNPTGFTFGYTVVMGSDKHKGLMESTGDNSNGSDNDGLHLFEVHQPTLTGFLTIIAFAITTVILYKCYKRRCFRCWRNTFFYKREPLQRGTHTHPATNRDNSKKAQPVTRSSTGQDDSIHSVDKGYYP